LPSIPQEDFDLTSSKLFRVVWPVIADDVLEILLTMCWKIARDRCQIDQKSKQCQ
jgi:hypothetical protein